MLKLGARLGPAGFGRFREPNVGFGQEEAFGHFRKIKQAGIPAEPLATAVFSMLKTDGVARDTQAVGDAG